MTTIRFDAAFLRAPRKGKRSRAVRKPPSVHVDRRARRLALAHLIERKITNGELRDFADAAARLGLTRARLTQVMDHLLMPIAEQEALLGTVPTNRDGG